MFCNALYNMPCYVNWTNWNISAWGNDVFQIESISLFANLDQEWTLTGFHACSPLGGVCVWVCVGGGGVFSASQRPVLCISFSLYRMFRPPLAIHSLLLGFQTSLSVSVLKVCSLLWISEWGPVRSTSLDMHIHTSLEIPLSFMSNLQNYSVTMMTTHFSLLFVLLLLTVCGPWKILHAYWMNEWIR